MGEEDNSWVFDSLICFLNGPEWNVPMQSFIEEKSLIFEPNTNDDIEYEKIFEEFKNLVDLMLGSYMEDIGITPQQFEDACTRGNEEMRHFDQNTFEHIWAANNYEIFKRMMTQRNVELQIQALELIEQKCGAMPQSFLPNKKPQTHTEQITAEISHGAQLRAETMEQEIMEEVKKQFPVDSAAEALNNEEVQNILEEKLILEAALKKSKETSANTSNRSTVQSVKTVEKMRQSGDELVESVKEKDLPNKNKEKTLTMEEISFDKKPITSEVDSIELKRRQEYLKAQRDKLVALKKQARKKQLDVKSETSTSRPKSARAAEAALTGSTPEMEPQQLQIRRALAEKLRSEVIGSATEK